MNSDFIIADFYMISRDYGGDISNSHTEFKRWKLVITPMCMGYREEDWLIVWCFTSFRQYNCGDARGKLKGFKTLNAHA